MVKRLYECLKEAEERFLLVEGKKSIVSAAVENGRDHYFLFTLVSSNP
jgi:hypothetical protein